MHKWRMPGYLPEQLSELKHVKRMPAEEGAGLFATQQPMAAYPQFMTSYRPHYSQHNMSALEFFQRAAKKVTKETGSISFVARLDNWPELLEDASPAEPFVAQPDDSMWQTFLWIGQAGTLTPCHQDYYHNFYAVLEGTKHFLLLPPSVHRLLYLHPSLHPAHRSSQVFVQKCRKDGVFPLAYDLPAMEATLERGEVLFIPALWFHHVNTTSFAVAVNVWSLANSDDVYARILEQPLPMPSEGETHAISGLRAFVLLLLQDLRAGPGGSAEACQISGLTFQDGFPSSGSEADAKAFVQSYLLESRYLFIPFGSPRYCESAADTRLLAQDRFLVRALDGVLRDVRSLFKQIERTRGRDVMLLYLANFVEHVALVVVGTPNVPQFLRDFVHC